MQEEAWSDSKSISSARCEARSRGGKAGATNGHNEIVSRGTE